MKLATQFCVLMCLLGNYALAADDEKKSIEVGVQAPDFELKGTDGKTYKLSEFKGKSAVVVAWYPKALTGG